MKGIALPVSILLGSLAAPLQADDYSSMLQYLNTTSIGDRALSGATGVVGINMAAGDFNLQANDRGIAIGDRASVLMDANQTLRHIRGTEPDIATARIEDRALEGVSGIVSINQASGVANIERNAVAIAPHVIQRGVTELSDISLEASAPKAARSEGPSTSMRSVAVEDTALRGVEGVVQLNQIAGSGNVTGNTVIMSVTPALR